MAAAVISLVLSSTAETSPSFLTSSSRLSAAESEPKSMNLRLSTVIVSSAAKLVVTFMTAVLPASS